MSFLPFESPPIDVQSQSVNCRFLDRTNSQTMSERLQVFDQVILFLIGQAETEAVVVTVDGVEQRLESAVMVEAALVFRLHEQTAFPHENAGQVHRSVRVTGRAVRLETVNLHLVSGVLIPARLGPERLTMAT